MSPLGASSSPKASASRVLLSPPATQLHYWWKLCNRRQIGPAPAERAAEIRIPIFMAVGAQDRRVPIEHGTRMRDALRATGHEPEWVVYSDEGHGWLRAENRIDFWTRVESFLNKNLR